MRLEPRQELLAVVGFRLTLRSFDRERSRVALRKGVDVPHFLHDLCVLGERLKRRGPDVGRKQRPSPVRTARGRVLGGLR